MKKFLLFLFPVVILFLAMSNTSGQVNNDQDEVLFSYGDKNVTKSEFAYIYEKNNVGKDASYTIESLTEYLELYVNFRLKVAEAKDLGYDTIASINKELRTYRKQLARNYMMDKEIIDKLVKEVYERLKTEVNVSHIMLELSIDAKPEDTLKVYKEMQKIRKRVVKGEDFAKVAQEVSDDKSAKDNGGNLGYFTAMQMVYPFESAAFSTKIGNISNIFRTQFGYHIIKVHDVREAKGEILTAHIFVRIEEDAPLEVIKKAKEKIDKAHHDLLEGVPFDKLAASYSDDKATASKGGQLPWFGVGRMVEEYQDAAFALKTNGDFSEPVLSPYGYHIIKRIDVRKMQSFESMESGLKEKIKRDPRFEVVKNNLIESIKDEYNFKEFPKTLEIFVEHFLSTLSDKEPWNPEKLGDLDGVLFTLLDTEFTMKDFAKNLGRLRLMKRESDMGAIVTDLYNGYVTTSCSEFEEARLELKYEDFKILMNEYRDGILLFELTDDKVWSKAIEDTIGLQKYHKENEKNYQWGERIKVRIYSCKDKESAENVKLLIKKEGDLPIDFIKDMVEEKRLGLIDIKDGVFEKGQNQVTDQIIWKMGLSNSISDELGNVSFANVVGILKPENKKLNEAKGYVVADYQEYLEKVWINSLREKYPVIINEPVLKSLAR